MSVTREFSLPGHKLDALREDGAVSPTPTIMCVWHMAGTQAVCPNDRNVNDEISGFQPRCHA